MNQDKNIIKIIVCVPYVRTFVVLVRKNQKINVIKEAFPNVNNQNKLIYWFNGSQISPHLTFGEINVQEFSSIIVTIQTDDIAFNRFFMKISKHDNIKKVVNNMKRNLKDVKKASDDRIINRCFNYEREKKKYFFIQRLKQLFDQFDFSKNQKTSILENQYSSINTSPIPILT